MVISPDPLADDLSILWNTPKKRKTVEKRHKRKFGRLIFGRSEGQQIPQRKHTIRVDHDTGEYFELNKVPKGTYERVMEETKAIQDRMSAAFGFEPKDKEVIVLYDQEKDKFDVDGKKHKLVEMEKERPAFFSANLMQKVNRKKSVGPVDTVRPSGLG